MNPALQWFQQRRGWTPFPFQREAWDAYARGESGLIHAPTGTGKTFAAFLGPLMEWVEAHPGDGADPPPLTVLWITPLRALAADTAGTLREPVEALGLPWAVELRTGDVSAAVKKRQRERLPTVLVTTPESLSLLLSYEDAREKFAHLRCVVVDEWHELLSSKRGTQTELALARLRRFCPELRTWGMSATLGNLGQAMHVLMGSKEGGRLIVGENPKEVAIETLAPPDMERFPWSGHLGTRLLDAVVARIDAARSTLLFTNTRSQAEIWFSRLMEARPDWLGAIALHHGSIDKGIREEVEGLLRQGRLRCVVCTSSLDLGVDFSPVDQVLQVGSPKGVARLLQRAGRSGHQPGATSRAIGVPTNAFELVEFAAARDAAAARRIESRLPLARPLDVLVQHLVTCAMGGGFEEAELLAEVRSTWAYRDLTDPEWRWCLDFVERGGATLGHYPQFSRVAKQGDRYAVATPEVARMHRASIGTITSNTAVLLKYQRGRTLGTVEEGFLAQLEAGDTFFFGGQLLEFVRVRNLVAEVKRATKRRGTIPVWQGGKSPLSTQLASAVRTKLDEARRGVYADAEMRLVRPILELQMGWSALPAPDELLIESLETRDGHHHFLYPFLGRLVHEGLGTLLAYRLTRAAPRTVSVNANDYGLELLSDEPMELAPEAWRTLLSAESLLEDLLACLNTSILARRQFHEIARVAGLIFQGYPGAAKVARHLQASSDLFYDVFDEFDPGNLLLDQARREVLERQLEARRMKAGLRRIERMTLLPKRPAHLTPLAFPLWAESLRQQHVTSETWEDRVRKMAVSLEKAARG